MVFIIEFTESGIGTDHSGSETDKTGMLDFRRRINGTPQKGDNSTPKLVLSNNSSLNETLSSTEVDFCDFYLKYDFIWYKLVKGGRRIQKKQFFFFLISNILLSHTTQ